MWYSAQTCGNGDMIRKHPPLTSEQARHHIPIERTMPTEQQTQEYMHLRNLLVQWNSGKDGQIPVELYRAVSQKVEDYRCNYDWRDRITTGKHGRKGLVSAWGDRILPELYHEIPERYTSINCLIPYIPVVRNGKYALASTQDADITETPILATPYEYDDAFMIPFSNGRLYAVRMGEKWRVLTPVGGLKPYRGLEPLCDYVIENIYPAVSDVTGEIVIWPVEADGKFGLIMPDDFIAPEYDDFNMDYESGNIELLVAGNVARRIEMKGDLPF